MIPQAVSLWDYPSQLSANYIPAIPDYLAISLNKPGSFRHHFAQDVTSIRKFFCRLRIILPKAPTHPQIPPQLSLAWSCHCPTPPLFPLSVPPLYILGHLCTIVHGQRSCILLVCVPSAYTVPVATLLGTYYVASTMLGTLPSQPSKEGAVIILISQRKLRKIKPI